MMFAKRSGVWLLMMLLVGCSDSGELTFPPLVVETYTVGEPVAKSQREFHGRVVPAELTRVAFRIPGKIATLPVQSGQKVSKGEVLATLDDAIQQQEMADARARFSLAKRQLKRAENLVTKGAITAAQRDEIRAGFRLARANLDLAKNHLRHTRAVAPFDGVVLDVPKEVFESAAAGDPVVTVYRTDRIDVLINLPDEFPAQIHRTRHVLSSGFEVQFSGENATRTMRILESSTARNPQTQTFQSWMTMPSQGITEKNFQPGLPVTVSVDLKQADFKLVQGLLVPLRALEAADQSDQFNVWRYRDGKVYSARVRVSQVTQEGALVSSGLQSGDEIVVSGLAQLSDGLPVGVLSDKREEL